jgi:hypothetical protein
MGCQQQIHEIFLSTRVYVRPNIYGRCNIWIVREFSGTKEKVGGGDDGVMGMKSGA